MMQLLHLVALVALVPLVFCQPVINFGQSTTTSCNGNTSSQYTLTVPAWTSIAADFVINVQVSKFNSFFDNTNFVTAGLAAGDVKWSISGDSVENYIKELWIPYQPEGTQVYVTVNCPTTLSVNVSLLALIPNGLNTTTVPGLNSSSASDGALHWWAVPGPSSSLYNTFVWAELCQVPADTHYYGFQFRVVFSGVTVTNNACTLSGSQTYDLSGARSNLNAMATVTAAAQWLWGQVAYVSVYPSGPNTSIALNYNVYSASNTPVEYTGGLSGGIKGSTIRIKDDLIIGGAFYPTNVDVMKLYYVKTIENPNKLDTRYFASACYLKSQAQSAYIPVDLKNASNDKQMKLSDNGLVKVPGFFKGKGFTPSLTFAVTYNDYVTVPTMQNFIYIDTTTSFVMVGALIGVSVFAGIVVVVAAVFAWKLRSRKGYNIIHH